MSYEMKCSNCGKVFKDGHICGGGTAGDERQHLRTPVTPGGAEMSEPAFKGTAKEGFERKYTVLNQKDYQKYVPDGAKERFHAAFGNVCDWIEDGRAEDGKEPYNSYIVINMDEPYVNEIIDVMKRNGHWG